MSSTKLFNLMSVLLVISLSLSIMSVLIIGLSSTNDWVISLNFNKWGEGYLELTISIIFLAISIYGLTQLHTTK